MIDRLFNLGWISSSLLGILNLISVTHINEYILLVTGLLGIILLVVQIRNKILQNKDLTKHLVKEDLDIKSKEIKLKHDIKIYDGKASK